MSKKYKASQRIRPSTAIVYIRVSSDEQVSNFSLDTQEKMCRERAEKDELSVLKVFREEGQSAKTSERTKFKEMRDYVQRYHEKIGYVIFGRIDRMNRDIIDYYIFKGLLRDYGIGAVSLGENITEGPESVLIEAVHAGMAQVENMAKSKRTTDGMKARAAAGYWSTSAPIGYVNGVDSYNRKNLIVDPIKAPHIRQLFEDFATGTFTYKELADKYADKLRSKNNIKICQQRIPPILQNPVYIARIENKEWNVSVAAKFPAIVSEEVFYRVQNLINGRPVGLKLPRRRFNDDFPLRGLVCSFCHRNLTGGWSKGRLGTKYAYYSCTNRECPMRRVHKSIKKKNIEDDFSDFLQRHEPSEEFLADLREAVKIAYASEMSGTINQNKEMDNKIEKLKMDKEKIVELMIEEPDLREEFKAQLIKKDAEIRELEAFARGSQLETCDMDAVMDFAISLIQTFHKSWKTLSARDLGVLTKLFFPKNLTYHYPDIQTQELSIVYILYRRFEMKNERMVPS